MIEGELRKIARSKAKGESPEKRPRTDSLVNTVFSQLFGNQERQLVDRQHFFRVAAVSMRNKLCDRARSENAKKRGGNIKHVPLDEKLDVDVPNKVLDFLLLEKIDSILDDWAQNNSLLLAVFLFRQFLEWTFVDIAEALEMSEPSVRRMWNHGCDQLRIHVGDVERLND